MDYRLKPAAWGVYQHEYAMNEIRAGRLSQHEGILGMYINDCINEGMETEQVLFYSENCFGTADAIKFAIPEAYDQRS
jgi:hypothetical protein